MVYDQHFYELSEIIFCIGIPLFVMKLMQFVTNHSILHLTRCFYETLTSSESTPYAMLHPLVCSLMLSNLSLILLEMLLMHVAIDSSVKKPGRKLIVFSSWPNKAIFQMSRELFCMKRLELINMDYRSGSVCEGQTMLKVVLMVTFTVNLVLFMVCIYLYFTVYIF